MKKCSVEYLCKNPFLVKEIDVLKISIKKFSFDYG